MKKMILLLATVLMTVPTWAASAGNYVEASQYLGDTNFDAWITLTNKLKTGFDQICGDTFCEGDYSNIQSLDYDCSINKNSGVIHECVWIFAASTQEVDPKTGDMVVTTHHWTCPSPLARDTHIDELMTALNTADPLQTVLPRSHQSIYDGLGDCL